MASISIDLSQIDKLKIAVAELNNQLPFAISKALNNVAFTAREDAKTEMKSVFDRPTTFALNSLYVTKSTKSNLTAFVNFRKPERLKDYEHYLTAQTTGDNRSFKLFEAALYNRNIIPRGYFTVPASGADFDQYGNMSRGQITQILSFFDQNSDTARNRLAKSTKSRYGIAYFVIKPGSNSNLSPGIYKRIYSNFGTAIKPVLIFTKKLGYQKRFDLQKIAGETYNREFPREFDVAFRYAMDTAFK